MSILDPLKGSNDSLGQATALNTKFKFDDTGNRVVENAFARRQANEAAKAKAENDKLFSALDFKVDTNKMLPVYGKAIADESAALMNKYLQYAKEDKATALNRLMLNDVPTAKARVQGMVQSNDAVMAAGKLDPNKYYVNSDMITDFRSPNVTFKDLAKYNNPNTHIGEDGTFGMVLTPKYGAVVKWDDKDYDVEDAKRTPTVVPGKYTVTKTRSVSDASVLNKAHEIAVQPDFIADFRYRHPESIALPLEQQSKAVLDDAIAYVTRQRPVAVKKIDFESVPKPSASESKIGTVTIQENVPETVTDFKTGEKSTVNIPYAMSIPEAKATTITANTKVYDRSTNQPIATSKNIYIKPDMVRVSKRVSYKDGKVVQQSEKYVPYVVGKVTLSADDPTPATYGDLYSEDELSALFGSKSKDKLHQEINLEVPLKSVEGVVRQKYNAQVDELLKKTEELNKGKTKTQTAKPAKDPLGLFN